MNTVMYSKWLTRAYEGVNSKIFRFYKVVIKHLGSLKLVTVGAFTPQKLANTTN